MNQSLLIVEDDEATRSFLADNLAADGYAVAAAAGAAEGIRQIEVRHPALVLLDLGLEEGHGLELLDRVRAADGMGSRIDPELPVIVITGRSGDADRVRGFARGADDFVVKPFLYQELLAGAGTGGAAALQRAPLAGRHQGGGPDDRSPYAVGAHGRPAASSLRQGVLAAAGAGGGARPRGFQERAAARRLGGVRERPNPDTLARALGESESDRPHDRRGLQATSASTANGVGAVSGRG